MRCRFARARQRALVFACALSLGCGRIGFEYVDQESELQSEGLDGAVEPAPDEPDDLLDEPEDPEAQPEPARDAGAGTSEPPGDWTGGLGMSDAVVPDSDAGGGVVSEAGAPSPLDAASPGDAAPAPRDAVTAPADAARDAAPTADAAPPPADAAPPPVDAGRPVPPSAGAPTLSCRDPGLIACDDFNGNRSGTTVSLAGAALSSGGFVVAPVSADSPRAAAHVSFNAVTAGALYLRFSLYVPANVATAGLTIARLGRFDVTSGFGVDVRLVRDGAVELASSAGVLSGSTGYRVARDRWVCVLVQADTIDKTSGSARVSFDGTQIVSATNIDTEPGTGISAAAAGVESVLNGQGAATVYVDGVLLVSQPPPACP
jgi:hypothetical protein